MFGYETLTNVGYEVMNKEPYLKNLKIYSIHYLKASPILPGKTSTSLVRGTKPYLI